MGIFDKRKSISRKELGSTLRKHHGRIPGTGGKKYYQRERGKITGEVFGAKYGSQIDKHEYKRAVRGLESDKRAVESNEEKRKIDEKIRYLKDLGGRNI